MCVGEEVAQAMENYPGTKPGIKQRPPMLDTGTVVAPAINCGLTSNFYPS